MKKQLAFVMVPALAVAMVIGGAAQRDLISPASGDLRGGGALPTGPDTVYDNSTNILPFLVNGIDAEWGDGATLAGTNRCVYSIILALHSLAPGNATCDVTVRIFEGGDDPAANDPRAMLWQSDTFNSFPISPGLAQYDFEVPNIQVPETVTWTLEISFCDTESEIGSRFISPPTTGTSQSYLWNHNADGTWESIVFDIGGPNSDLGCTILAVCEGCLCGDSNCDSRFNGADIDPFFVALGDPAAWQEQFPDCNPGNLDINGDGLHNAFDIDLFFAALGQGGCP